MLAVGLAREGEEMISVTEQGYGKRTKLADYPLKGRGGKGVIGHTAHEEDRAARRRLRRHEGHGHVRDLARAGIVVRVPAGDIRRVGRASQGVRTMRVEEGATVVALAPVIASR